MLIGLLMPLLAVAEEIKEVLPVKDIPQAVVETKDDGPAPPVLNMFKEDINPPERGRDVIQTIILNENFSNWGPFGDNPPSGWTIQEYGTASWDNNDWNKFYYTSWSDTVARVYYSPIENQNDCLITPGANFVGAAACTLSFYCYYNDLNSTDTLFILGSSDGVNFDDVIRVWGSADTGGTVKANSFFSIDITSFADEVTGYKIAFKYVGNNGFYAYVDDVCLFKDSQDTLVYSNFNGWGPFGDNPPAGWTILDLTPFTPTWDNNDWHKFYYSSFVDTVARVYYSPVENQNEWLITPAMNLTPSSDAVFLSMKQFYDEDPGVPSDTGFIYGSINGGSTWPYTIATYTADQGSGSAPNRPQYDITSWANNQSNVKIAFRYKGADGLAWYLDSVKVETVDLLDNDIGVAAILAPDTLTVQGLSFPVSARVSNYGVNNQSSVLVRFQIYDSTNALVYNQTHTIPSLPAHVDSVISFPNWTAGEANYHTMQCFTNLGSDQDRSNDTSYSYTRTYPHRSTGGPIDSWSYADNYGGGPAFNWIDITGVGTAITFGSPDDNNSGMHDMGMFFNFFGTNYQRISVVTNGWLSFTDSTTTALTNAVIPSTSLPQTAVFLLWDDLHLGTGTVYKYYDAVENRFIVEYHNIEFYSSGGPDCIDMEVIFDGDNNSIKMQYNNFCTGCQTDISIGIENQAGTVGLAYDNFGEIGQTPVNGLAVTWTYNPLANDIGAAAILAPTSATIVGTASPVSARVHNYGSNTQTNVPVHFHIYDSTSAQVYHQTVTLSSIGGGEDSTIVFPNWTPAEANSHSLVAYTVLGSDVAPSNDTAYGTTFTSIHRGNGGPVEYWSYADNITGGGPAFNWVDISGVGTPITFGSPDDSNSGFMDMGITFNFFGESYSQIAVSTNGWLSFTDGTSSALTNTTIPATSLPNAGVFLLWDDLHVGSGTVYQYYDDLENRFIVHYNNVEFYSSGGPDCIDMEVIFDADDNSIKMQYNDFCDSSQTDISIGIENQDGTVGLAYDNNGEFVQRPYDGVAVTWTYSPPAHDVRPLAIVSPTSPIYSGQTYSIEATVGNNSSSTETFNVRATDNHGYSNTQAITNLGPFESVIVTFPGWNISLDCSDYVLTVVTQLAGDVAPSNDTLRGYYTSVPPANTPIVYDNGTATNAWRFVSPSNIIANKFDVNGSGDISAIAFGFTNLDNFPTWPDANRDSVNLYIFVDSDFDNLPDASPVYTERILTADHGMTIWPVGCNTTIIVGCAPFWAGWSLADSLKPEGMLLDNATNFPSQKWQRLNGVWGLNSSYTGDDFIRAYIDVAAGTGAQATFAVDPVSGNAPVGDSISVANSLDNTGLACDLVYTVAVIQQALRQATSRPVYMIPKEVTGTASALEATPELLKDAIAPIDIITTVNEKGTTLDPVYPPMVLDFGGPDLYGYTWIDSDEPAGPTFSWIDISSIGTPVTWDTCSVTFGCQDEGITALIPMGMSFNFYGTVYNDVLISSNGWASFVDQANWYLSNATIPTAALPNTIIAALWDDLDGDAGDPGTTGVIYTYYDAVQNQFIISWVDWAFYATSASDFSFQIILDADDNTIVTQYQGATFLQNDITIGIENADGSDGSLVVFDAAYLHDALAIKFIVPTIWLTTDLVGGTLAPGDPAAPFNINMNAAELPDGTYNGALVLGSNDSDEPVKYLGITFIVGEGGGCVYVPGDANGSDVTNGLDVTYMVNWLKGGPNAPPDICDCPPNGVIYAAADANGSCVFNGLDVTYLVNYLKGGPNAPRGCTDCPPAGFAPEPGNGTITKETPNMKSGSSD